MNYLNSIIMLLNHKSNRDERFKSLIRILSWKMYSVVTKFPRIVNITLGVKCICYPESSYGSLVVYTKLPDYPEMKMILKFIKKGNIFVDVGAHIGLYSILAASRGAKVYAFEPSGRPLKNLYENIELNKYEKDIQVIEKVVSNTNNFENFIYEQESEINHISTNGKGKRVQSVRLDTFIRNLGINRIDFLKIDVEGAEIKVLKGLGPFLKDGCVKVIIAEVNKNCHLYGYSPNSFIAFIENSGYEVYYFEDTRKLKKASVIKGNSHKTFNIVCLRKGTRMCHALKSYYS